MARNSRCDAMGGSQFRRDTAIGIHNLRIHVHTVPLALSYTVLERLQRPLLYRHIPLQRLERRSPRCIETKYDLRGILMTTVHDILETRSASCRGDELMTGKGTVEVGSSRQVGMTSHSVAHDDGFATSSAKQPRLRGSTMFGGLALNSPLFLLQLVHETLHTLLAIFSYQRVRLVRVLYESMSATRDNARGEGDPGGDR